MPDAKQKEVLNATKFLCQKINCLHLYKFFSMTVRDYKISITGLLFDIEDAAVLEACFKLLEKQAITQKIKDKKKVVGYAMSGAPITVADLEREVGEAVERVKAGDGISHEDLIKSFEKW
jgi:predicted DNA-binding transcriptional regulator